MSGSAANPHAGGPVLRAGAPLATAGGAVILLHGRGGSASDILSLASALAPGEASSGGGGLAWLAPEASGRSWYPNSFLAPRASNEPYLASALERVAALVAEVESAGIGRERIVLGGFSQGACLSSEFVASHPAGYAGLLAFTGGLIGPPGTRLSEGAGGLGGMPALLLSGVPDAHVPWGRVEETAEVLTRMGARVTLRPYPGRGHSVSEHELELARAMLEAVFGSLPARG